MTRQEVSQQIGSREFSVWEIINLSGGLLFEHIGKWLLLAAIVFLPTGFILQYAAMQLPLNQLISLMQGENLETLYTMDWSPYLIYYGLQMGMNLIWIYCNLAVAVYTDRWLQSERQEMRFGEMLLTAVKRWPAGMLMPILLLLAVLAAAMLTILVGTFLLPMMMILLIALTIGMTMVYYMGVTATAIREKAGASACRYAVNVMRRRRGKTLGVVLIFQLVSAAVAYLLEMLTSSFVVLAGNVWLYSLVSAAVSVIAALSTILLQIGITIHFINQEQLGLMEERAGHPELPGDF